jgi:hypothetical protein
VACRSDPGPAPRPGVTGPNAPPQAFARRGSTRDLGVCACAPAASRSFPGSPSRALRPFREPATREIVRARAHRAPVGFPALVGSGSNAVDVSGRSVKDPRVRAIHTTDPNLQGGTAHLIGRDPFLAYQIGRNLNFLEFTARMGTFDAQISNLAGLNPDGRTAKITANNQVSCVGCHNLPVGNPGGGPNFSKDSGFGRNTPHYYGGGIVEMLAIQVRSDMLPLIDTNQDGWVSVAVKHRCQLSRSSGLHT